MNNQWAISTHRNLAQGGPSFAARGLAYDIASIRVDGNDFLAMYSVTQWAAERARLGMGSTLIEVFTYRAEAHSSSDDPSRYRPSEDYKSWPLGDPIERLKTHLISIKSISEDDFKKLETNANEEVIAAYKEAESFGTHDEGPHPPISTLFEDVYAVPPNHLLEQRGQLGR